MDTSRSRIYEGLNEAQKNAVECIGGPVLIVAGAGSGKTRVLTCRVANILDHGCPAERVLALTFTKKAAGEMKERIAAMVGWKNSRHLAMGTFHSIFIRFLRDYAGRIGYPADFTIRDTSESIASIKACIKELGLDDKYKPKDVLGRISKAKNNLVTDSSYRNSQKIVLADVQSGKARLCDLYSLYQKKCRESGVMDFDDILLNTNILFRDHPDALDEVASRFDYILVDEYQDTNYAQYLILKKLSARHRNICVVGDDSQSIYAFRGAKIENILNFKKDYPDCRLFRLEQNYRSTQTIVSAANSLIARNENRIPKECYSNGNVGAKIKYNRCYSEVDEASGIAASILDTIRSGAARYEDFAILYRTNGQSRQLEDSLRRRNIPYHVYSGNSFFERAEVKDMMAYFKLVTNPNDDESFKRVINKPARGIGDTSLSTLAVAASDAGVSLFKAVYLETLSAFGLKAPAVSRMRAFCDAISSLASARDVTDAYEMALKIADKGGLYAFYKADTSIEGQARTGNLDELLNSVKQFVEERQEEILSEMEDIAKTDDGSSVLVTLADYLENVSLLSNIDAGEDENADNKVALMTVHSAKGLEFTHVYIAGMEENLFPSSGELSDPTSIEEERRLFYVALTRARETVDVSFVENRLRNGRHEYNRPSRFLREIDSRYVDNPLSDEDFDSSAAPDPFARYSRQGGSSFSGGRGGWSGSDVRRSGVDSPRSSFGGRPSGREIRRDNASSGLRKPAAATVPDPSFTPTPMQELETGMRVMHKTFGCGLIEEMSGRFPDLKARINFDDVGIKIIMLKYAKLQKI